MNALLRRAPSAANWPTGALELDPSIHALRIGERTASSTPTEFRIFAALAANPAAVVRRGELVAVAWLDGAIVHENTLDTYIARLRRKLASIDAEETIETSRGAAYTLR